MRSLVGGASVAGAPLRLASLATSPARGEELTRRSAIEPSPWRS